MELNWQDCVGSTRGVKDSLISSSTRFDMWAECLSRIKVGLLEFGLILLESSCMNSVTVSMVVFGAVI
jgi:hypothetical protein